MLANNTKKALKISPKSGSSKTILTKRGYAIVKKHFSLEDITVRKIYSILMNNFKIALILKTEQKVLDGVNRSGERTPKEMTDLNIFIKGYNY